MFTFLPGPFLVQFSGPFYLSTDMINEIPATEWDFAVFITCGIKENVPNMAAVKPNISMLVINHSKKILPIY